MENVTDLTTGPLKKLTIQDVIILEGLYLSPEVDRAVFLFMYNILFLM